MRSFGLALALVANAAAAQRPYDLPIRNAPVQTIAEFSGVEIGAVRPSGNPNRLYYRREPNQLYVFDVVTKKSTLVAEAEIWNLDISPTNDRLVFARNTEDGKVSNVWIMPLDPKTGLSTAPARRLALTPGDQPRFSSDGKWVAFAAYDSSDWSASQHLAIVAADGGPERAVTRLTGGIGRLQWTPDGRTIYFAASRRGQPGWKLLRASASGGPVDTLGIEFVAGAPGLSPDGRLVALLEGGGARNYVVADARGVPVARFSLPAPLEVGWGSISWSGPRQLVVSGVNRSGAIRVAEIDNGASREIVPAESEPELPAWSPDGKSVAVFAKSRRNRVLLVVDAMTGARREFTTGVVQSCCIHDGSHGLQWSPDGKAIVFHGEYREPLRVIELATGAVRQVGPKGSFIDEYRWRSDSRALQYTVTANPRDAYRTIHETTLDGTDRVLIDRVPAGVGGAGMRSDTTAVVNTDSGVFVANVRTQSWKRVRPYFSPWISSNRQGTLFVLRDVRSGTRELEVFDAAGTRTAAVNFAALPDWVPYQSAGVAFHPDGRLFLVGRTNGGPYAVYAADLKGEPRKLFDLPNKATPPYVNLSADGKSLLYTVEGPPTSVIARIDLTSIVPVSQTSKP